ncbi:hypothetical protein [Aeropyrum pernix]|uniref:hypothetical protein n=1 Tax=Aeropyrum pernix TaxID=56636 RepID=UPI001037EB09|nr:hypothetical protein [Aeropyrum pernix]
MWRKTRDTLRMIKISWLLRNVRVSSVDEVSVAKLRKALARSSVKPLIGGLGDLSLVLRTHYKGETLMVLHLVIGRRANIKHYGILGLKGWNPSEPELTEFRIGRKHFEFNLLNGSWRRKRFKRRRV